MSQPNVSNGTMTIVAHAAEVGGRAKGLSEMPSLVPEEAKRARLKESGEKIIAAARDATAKVVARMIMEYVDSRVAWGIGRGIDRGFDVVMTGVADKIRTSLPDKTTANPEYRSFYKDGTTSEYTSPSIKQDPELCMGLRKSVEASGLAVKSEVLGILDGVQPFVDAAATGLRNSEQQMNELFKAELTARTRLIDVLWEERRTIETTLGRGGRGLARFVFFDFRPARGGDATVESEANPTVGGGSGPGPV